MGGLLSRVESKSIQKIPLLGDIPILGNLFRDVTYSKTDLDVVFVLTPTILTRTEPIQAPAGGTRRVMPPIRFVPVSHDAKAQLRTHAKRDSIPSPVPAALSPSPAPEDPAP
jgi:type II secretory pathway component GspD/PulD (secretin)